MKQESSPNYICIYDWEEDKFLLEYPNTFGSWEICHLGADEVQ